MNKEITFDTMTDEEVTAALKQSTGIADYVKSELHCAFEVLKESQASRQATADKIEEIVRARAATTFMGLPSSRELVTAAMKRILIVRGHLRLAPAHLLPAGWRAMAAQKLHVLLRCKPGYNGSADDCALYVSSLWEAYTQSTSARRVVENREKRAIKRNREEETIVEMASMMQMLCQRIALQGNSRELTE